MAGSYNPNNNNQLWSNLNNNNSNRGFFSRFLRDLSNWGMNYDDMVTRNKVTIGINEDPNQVNSDGGMYDFFSQRAISSLLSKKSISYLDKAYLDKRRILREYSIKDEIMDFVTTICDESVIYDDERKFCQPTNLSEETSQEIKDRFHESFESIYNNFGFSDGKRAWDIFRTLLIDGFIAFEIVWDDKQQNIIGFEEIDPVTVIPGYEPNTNTHIWIQYPEDPSVRRIILDSQLIYISYKSQNDYSETSYVEGLIRPYNQLKIIEQTRIMFNLANATIYQKFTIPIKDLPRQRAEESVGKMIANYSEEVEWDDSLGTVEINGSKHIPYNKQLWFPEGESGTPNFELVAPDGHNLNENDMLTWFFNALKRASKIPFTRFDKDNGGGNIHQDSAEMTRDEVKFSNFISRLRTIFKEILTKPMRLQMLMDFPELKDDDKFLNSINVEFNSNDLFEEWKKLRNIEKRASIVESLMNSININGVPYFHPEFLVNDIMKLTEEEKQENEALHKEKPIQTGEGGSGAGLGGEFGGGGEFDASGGGDSFADDFDIGGDDLDTDIGGGDDIGGDDIGSGDEDFEF